MWTQRMYCHLAVLTLPGALLSAQALKVAIDVKPGDTPTTIERDRGGMIPVAILSSAGFDALTVDPATVRVGPTGNEAEPFKTTPSDVNEDKRPDLLLLVRLQDLKITCQDKVIRVTAKTNAGADIEGSEAVTIIGCDKG